MQKEKKYIGIGNCGCIIVRQLPINESVFDKVKDFFGKTVEGEAKESIYNWIQIFRQQCLDKKYIHYELINNHIELHFEIHPEKGEDYRKDEEIVALSDYLKGELKKYKCGYWGRDNNEYRCQYVEELNEGNYLEVTKEFVEKMDFLIDKFKYIIQTRKQRLKLQAM